MTDVWEVDRDSLDVTRRELVRGAGVAATGAVAGVTPRRVAAQQDPDNEISGTVTDSSGGVDGATVVAVPHDDSLDPLATTTDGNGDYVFAETDLYTGDNLYHVIARDGTESDPRRGQQNYPFVAANGGMATDVIDDFESGDLSAYSGATGDFEVTQTSPVLEGSYSMKNATQNNNTIISSSSLGNIPSRGEAFSWYAYQEATADPACVFFYSGSSSFYSVVMGAFGGSLDIRKDGTAGGDSIASTPVAWSESQWYEIFVQPYSGGAIEATAYEVDAARTRVSEVASVSVTDTDYSSGEIGWYHSYIDGSASLAAYDIAINRGSI